MKYTCIKLACTNSYESDDSEAYYCPSCQKTNKELAKRIDAQVASRPQRSRVSKVQEYESQLKQSTLKAGGMPGIKVNI